MRGIRLIETGGAPTRALLKQITITRFQEIGRKLKEHTPIWGCDGNRVRDLPELEESGCHRQFLIPGTPK